MKTRKRKQKTVPKIEIVLEARTKRKSAGKQYCKWSEEKMIQALEAMRTKGVGLNKAAKLFSVPKTTLKRHLEGKNRFAAEGRKVMGRPSSIPENVENEIKERIQRLEDAPFVMTGVDVRKLAYEVAESKGLQHTFSKKKKMAGKQWYYNFIKRHPELNFRRSMDNQCTLAAAFEQQLREGETPILIQERGMQENSIESRNKSRSNSDKEDIAQRVD